MRLISIQNLSVRYDEAEVLDKVNLDIWSDDFLGIIGPNGGGKTTLVKAILGLVPYSGKVDFDESFHLQQIGYLPQMQSFDKKFPMTVSELVLGGMQSKRKFTTGYTRKDKSKVDDAICLVGVDKVAKHPIDELSGGQLQRALLARAIVSDPKLLILDEPANFVDNEFERAMYEILKELNDRMAIIMVSHDVGTITSFVKSIVCVNRDVHRHDTNDLTAELLEHYDCPIQIVAHGPVPHTVLGYHDKK